MKRLLIIAIAASCLLGTTAFAGKISTRSSEPETCAVGDIWINPGADSNDRIYTCTATNTWTLNSARPWVAQATAPADLSLLWFDTDQVEGYLVLKVHNGTTWVQQAIGEGGSFNEAGDYTLTGSWNFTGATVTGLPGTDDQTASEVTVTDSGGYFTSSNVEDVLQELGLSGTTFLTSATAATTYHPIMATATELEMTTGTETGNRAMSPALVKAAAEAITYQVSHNESYFLETIDGDSLAISVAASNAGWLDYLGLSDLGTFTGSTITDNVSFLVALQELETAVESATGGGLLSTDIDTSAEIAATVTDETGSGSLVFGTSPTLTTPDLGEPSAITLTNGTGLPASGLNLDPTILSSTQTLSSFGGYYIVTGAYTITLPAVASGLWGCFQVEGAYAASVDPNASDLITLNGTALTDGTAIVSDGTTGNSICLQYRDANGWTSWGNNGFASE